MRTFSFDDQVYKRKRISWGKQGYYDVLTKKGKRGIVTRVKWSPDKQKSNQRLRDALESKQIREIIQPEKRKKPKKIIYRAVVTLGIDTDTPDGRTEAEIRCWVHSNRPIDIANVYYAINEAQALFPSDLHRYWHEESSEDKKPIEPDEKMPTDAEMDTFYFYFEITNVGGSGIHKYYAKGKLNSMRASSGFAVIK